MSLLSYFTTTDLRNVKWIDERVDKQKQALLDLVRKVFILCKNCLTNKVKFYSNLDSKI